MQVKTSVCWEEEYEEAAQKKLKDPKVFIKYLSDIKYKTFEYLMI